jgi:hypothetical protein
VTTTAQTGIVVQVARITAASNTFESLASGVVYDIQANMPSAPPTQATSATPCRKWFGKLQSMVIVKTPPSGGSRRRFLILKIH